MTELVTGKYTEADVEQIHKAWHGRESAPYINPEATRIALNRLLDAGITVTLPDPRFRAAKLLDGAAWEVRESDCGWGVAHFNGNHPDPEGAARAEADRLNRKHAI